MKYILLFSIFLASAFGQLTYPVDVVNDRFTVLKDGELVDRGRLWPRADGMQIADLAANIVILKEVVTANPAFDPATQKLGPGVWIDDVPTATATFSRPVIALSQAELDQLTENADLQAKATQLANAVATLRQWSDDADAVTVTSGNAVATLQTTLDRLSIFFDRFADLLEVQGIE